METTGLLGPGLALLCAATWSLSVILFKLSGARVHPILLNLCKNSVGLALFIPTIYLAYGSVVPPIALHDTAVLILSGVLGIGLADAMVLKALRSMGASRVAVIECVYSPFIIFLSVLFLGESLTWSRMAGAALVVGALLCVSFTPGVDEGPRAGVLAGIRWGVLGLLSMAGGIVMVKPLFAHVPLFWIIGIRLAAGVGASLLLFLALPQKRALLGQLALVERKTLMAIACVLSTYVSMTLWVAGYKFQDATIAAVLNQTSTIFTVVLAAIVLKERFTPAKLAGAVLAVAGVLTITLA